MCILALSFHASAAWPVMLAANRDEYFDRPSAPPGLLATQPRAIGGRDVLAGGTWLGVNEFGVLAALTNRYAAEVQATPRLPTSRGRLCLEALHETTARAAALRTADAARRQPYNPFSLFIVSPTEAWFVTNADGNPEPVALSAGWHILGNRGLDDPADPRVRRCAERIAQVDWRAASADTIFGELAALCGDHGAGAAPEAAALCLHKPDRGTRSATLILYGPDGRVLYRHADGPPCRTAYSAVPLPWQA